MKITFELPALLATFFVLIVTFTPAPLQGNQQQPPHQHERLQIRNTFKTPEEVVSYYCSRDASGFVWSGLLESERKAFTTWNESPQHDMFYVARKFTINPERIRTVRGNEALVDVKYDLIALADANGTRAPVDSKTRVVTFNLRKVNGTWKITRPLPQELAPVVLESKFPLPKP